MELIDYIVAGVIMFVLFEGFTGEFSNPTILDFVKWGCCVIMIISYCYYKWKNNNE